MEQERGSRSDRAGVREQERESRREGAGVKQGAGVSCVSKRLNSSNAPEFLLDFRKDI